tara:strand:- start:42441 stop:43094 length:654 start_codon:yes stop_codon:yes gene_type:complete
MMYSTCDFSKLDSIGVICRGASISKISKVSDRFEACFLVGQFENGLLKIGNYLCNKHIVQVINKCAIQTDRKVCEQYRIRDIQCNFGSYFGEELSEGKTALFKKIRKKNPWAEVHLVPEGLTARRPMDKWETTGIYAVDLACFFQPKEIHVIGLDFYESDYFAKEKLHAGIKANRARGRAMREQFMKLVDRDRNIHFNVVTHSRHLKSGENLSVRVI